MEQLFTSRNAKKIIIHSTTEADTSSSSFTASQALCVIRADRHEIFTNKMSVRLSFVEPVISTDVSSSTFFS